MASPLDRPIWTALTTRHATLALGDTLARRYPADISPFAATENDSPESLAALSTLAASGKTMLFLQSGPVALPAGLTVVKADRGVQMLAEAPFPAVRDSRICPLGPADAAEMLTLAEVTKPGPFSVKSGDLGDFWCGVSITLIVVFIGFDSAFIRDIPGFSGIFRANHVPAEMVESDRRRRKFSLRMVPELPKGMRV